MAQNGRVYKSKAELVARQEIWTKNDLYITEFNKEKHSYTLGHNEFSDKTNEEFQKLYLPSKLDLSKPRLGQEHIATGAALPSSVDWRPLGYVTPIKNQGQCGSCWAFSTTGSLEGQHFNKTGQLVSLSEQNLVDCSDAEGNQGCNGGLMDQAFTYIIKNNGLDTEASYPYTAMDGKCKFEASTVGATVSSFKDIIKGSESDLQNAVATVGPVSVAIDASLPSFQMYHTGVYDPPLCSPTQLDHGVLAVGYGTLDGKDYWIVKNSWGVTWGQKGYILMARNANNKCGIATSASYPIV
jgi:cathepsin L